MVRMKNMQILVLFLIGAVVTVSGVVMKISELPIASLFLIIGMTFEAVALLLLIWKIFRKNKPGSFLDS